MGGERLSLRRKKMNDILFSIIVPCYNIEKYVDQCIESVVAQSYLNWELILVDDKSTDLTVEKIQVWSDKDSRIRLYKKEHSGLPATRNEGLKHIRGDYVCLLDGDDYWDSNHLNNLLEIINKFPADMIIQNQHTNVYDGYSEDIILFSQNEKEKEPLDVVFSLKNKLPASAVLTVYKKHFLDNNKIWYNEKLNCSEDLDFFLNAISHNPQICFAYHKFYYYRHNNDGAMTYSMSGSMHQTRNMILKKWIEYYNASNVEGYSGKLIAQKLAQDLCRQMYDVRLNYNGGDKGVIVKFYKDNERLITENHMFLYYLYLNVLRYNMVIIKRRVFGLTKRSRA